MRIFYAAADSPNYWGLPGSRLWYDNLYRPLVALGHELVRFDYDFGPHNSHLDPAIPEHRQSMLANRGRLGEALWKQVTAAHRAAPIDVLFCYFYSAYVEPEVIRRISGLGVTTVNWFCNASYQFNTVAEIAPAFDYCLVPEKFRLDDYRRIGARPIYCQEAANPQVYKSFDLPVEFDVTFVGQAYGDRPAHIRHLVDQGIDVRVWGPNWQLYTDGERPRVRGWKPLAKRIAVHLGLRTAAPPLVSLPAHVVGGVLSDEDLIRMYSRSKVCLGFSSCGETHASGERIMQIRLRDFEVPMSGGFYLVEYMQELEEFYEIGKEIVCYTDPDDLADKARYYATHDSEREAVRHAGQQRCLRDHTWQKRFTDAFYEMKLR